MARYRLCGGLAIMPEHDMAMLADMSARGWHLSGFSCGILYRFEAGEPHAYDYAVDFQRDFSAEAQELYRIGGWQSVALGSSWQIVRAESRGADLVLIDTAGRLHTSADLMRELEKVVNVVRKRSQLPVYTVLVTDATTGQNGLSQAREFDRALDLDGVIVTKLDGTAKGGIALAVSHELGLPVLKIGVGEGLDDLRDFDAHDFARALVGEFDERA